MNDWSSGSFLQGRIWDGYPIWSTDAEPIALFKNEYERNQVLELHNELARIHGPKTDPSCLRQYGVMKREDCPTCRILGWI